MSRAGYAHRPDPALIEGGVPQQNPEFPEGPKLASALHEPGPGKLVEIVEKPKESKDVTVPYRVHVVERSFAWMSRCRRLAIERALENSPAQVRPAACRFLIRRIARGEAA